MLSLKTILGKANNQKRERDASSVGLSRRLSASDRSDYRTAPPPHRLAIMDTRVAQRFVPEWTSTVLSTANGDKLGARIINMSALGVAIEADFSKLSPQSVTVVGKRRVKVGRKIMGGSVFLFDPPISQRICNIKIVL